MTDKRKPEPSRLSDSLSGAKSPKRDAPRGNVLGKDNKRFERDKELENLEKGRKS